MNKLLTRFAVLAVGAGMAVAVGVASSKGAVEVARAEDAVSTLSFSAKADGSGTADDGAVWTVTSDATESTFDNAKGIHFGTGSAAVKYIKLETGDISGTIKEVKVNAATANGVSAKVSVAVDGAAFGGEAQAATSTAADYTFTGSAVCADKLTVELSKEEAAVKALYLKSVIVTYEAIAKPALESLKITAAPTKAAYVEEAFFESAGLAVSAVYADGSEKDVSDKVTVVDADKLIVAGQTKVVVSYTERGVTKTVDVAITVSANPNKKVYKPVTAGEAGDFVISYTGQNEAGESVTYAALPTLVSSRLSFRTVDVDSEGNIVTGDSRLVWTLAAVTVEEKVYYTIFNETEAKYLSYSMNNDQNVIALVSEVNAETKTEYWNVESKAVTLAEGEATQLVIEAAFRMTGSEGALSESRFLSFNATTLGGFACYKSNSSQGKLVTLSKDNGVVPAPTPVDPEPEPEPEPAKKGCRGEIVTTSILLSTLALAGVTLLGLKKKRD